MKKITINGIEFEVIKPNTKEGESIINRCISSHRYDTIDEAYSRPSMTKREIWGYWLNWHYETQKIDNPDIWSIEDMFISGKSSNFFSICFTGENGCGENIYGFITVGHNKVVII